MAKKVQSMPLTIAEIKTDKRLPAFNINFRFVNKFVLDFLNLKNGKYLEKN